MRKDRAEGPRGARSGELQNDHWTVDEPARALNGFVGLRLSGERLVEEFRDENGALRRRP